MSVCDPVNGMHGVFRGALPAQLFAPRPGPRLDRAAEFDWARDVGELASTLREHADEVSAVIVEPIVQV